MTYELKDKKTGKTVCFFSARTYRAAVETYFALDPKLLLRLAGGV
jgi:iron only hydrogenase large subunit-like protein